MGKNAIGGHTLNRRVAILRRGPGSDDGFGKQPGELRRLCWRFASVKPARRRAAFDAGGTEAVAELSVWLRRDGATTGIRVTDQVAYESQLYEIVAIPIEVGFHAGIELLIVAADGQAAIDAAALPAWAQV